MSLLAPSILAADFTNLESQIKEVEKGGADLIHCDIMDGIFVPNITFGPIVVSAVNNITSLPIDVHLMIKNPQDIIPEFINSGADYITVHQEEVVHLDRVINLIQEQGVKAGVSINPATPVEVLFPVLEFVDLVLIMSVNPGFGGQKFIEYTLDKVKTLKNIKDERNLNFDIEIDGGINSGNIKIVRDVGVDIIVAGTEVFNSEDIFLKTQSLKNIIK